MRYRDGRRSICVSSQSGCPLTCTFCATGAMQFGRNLTASEILDQALHFRRLEAIDHCVFMGMGEPFMNFDNVIAAARRLPDVGITPRRTTISTVGWLPGLTRFIDEVDEPIRLALSLHAANPALRSQLMPVNDRYPLADVLAECRRYVELRGRKVFIEYVMLEGVNDTPRHAAELAGVLDPKAFKVNLIPYNPTGMYGGSSRDAIAAFKHVLDRARIPATVRLTRGRDIAAACGQLAAATAGAGCEPLRSTAAANREQASLHRLRDRSAAAPGSRGSSGLGLVRSTFAAHSGSHQFQRPSSCIDDGTSSSRISVASMITPAARPMPNSLMSRPGPVERAKKANMSTPAPLVTSLPVRARPSEIASLVSRGLVVGLADPRDHEDLVVHRDSVEEGEDHQRDPRDHDTGCLDAPDRLAPVALLEDEDHDAVGAAERDQVEDDRLQRQHDRPERPGEQDESEHDHEEQHLPEVAVDGVHEVAFLGRRAAERQRHTRRPRRPRRRAARVSWRFEMTSAALLRRSVGCRERLDQRLVARAASASPGGAVAPAIAVGSATAVAIARASRGRSCPRRGRRTA